MIFAKYTQRRHKQIHISAHQLTANTSRTILTRFRAAPNSTSANPCRNSRFPVIFTSHDASTNRAQNLQNHKQSQKMRDVRAQTSKKVDREHIPHTCDTICCPEFNGRPPSPTFHIFRNRQFPRRLHKQRPKPQKSQTIAKIA
jgi:hypothetical protein